MKISQRVEDIFSHAVALDQSGKLRNTIYAVDNRVYVLNYDSTVLLRFRLRKTETPFANPVSFRANDYDSRQFHEEDGKIIFVIDGNGFTRKKSCGTPEAEPADIEDLYKGYSMDGQSKITLPKDVLPLLDPALSHLEISGEDRQLKIVQRNIYSGAVIEISRTGKKGLGLISADEIREDFGPVGIRTGDFTALFSFCDAVEFEFGDAGFVRVRSLDNKMDMTGLLALCTYDELGTIQTCEGGTNDGRKEQEDRRSEPEPDSTTRTRRTRTSGRRQRK
jgi:hypothetical protein